MGARTCGELGRGVLGEGFDEGVGFGDAGAHAGEEFLDLFLDAGGFVFEGADGGGVEVVFEEEDVVLELGEDGFHGIGGSADGAVQLGVAVFCVATLLAAVTRPFASTVT